MARKLPKPLHRREILYNPTADAVELSKQGDVYFDAGLIFDATAFYAQAKDKSGLKRIHATALEVGDAFLMAAVKDVFPELVTEADWDELGKKAKALGKDYYINRAEMRGVPIPPPLDEHAITLAAQADVASEEPAPSANRSKKERRRKRRG